MNETIASTKDPRAHLINVRVYKDDGSFSIYIGDGITQMYTPVKKPSPTRRPVTFFERCMNRVSDLLVKVLRV